MKKSKERPVLARALRIIADSMLSSSANSRCVFVYHQPKQPSEIKKFRKF